ncbi:neugrin [Triplophysa dalaica]|uniref:neugrin n=1 Tax=Triplophysa dalaica TaxID=1582913 RepID=UPI0024E0018B|nr:neugrin [Triplophysa dalaica]XP_056629346.1 neugrin [Triplophysa dalaica]
MVTPLRMGHMLASKLASLPGPSACQICRPASRKAFEWMSQRRSDTHPKQKQYEDMFEDDHDMDVVEAKLSSIISKERRHHKAVKFHKMKRQMNKPGAPERRLSWDAIEQIRYLKQESPEEWTLERLAEAFSVSSDVISRVLRGTFTPTPERKLNQDSKVLSTTGKLSIRDGKSEQSRLPMADSKTPAMLSPGNTGALATLSNRSLALKKDETGLMPSGGNIPSISTVTSRLSTVQKATSNLQDLDDSLQKTFETDAGDEIKLEEEWDGVVLTEEELERIALTVPGKPSSVEQKGREFFDCDGNFLYRI